MKRSDLMIVAGLGLVGLVAAFWFVVLAPKREEANELGTQVEELQAAVSDAEQLAAAAAAAEKDYGRNYHRLVVLGKAVPEDADTPSLLVELQRIADDDNIDFESITLAEGSGAAAEAAQVATPPPLTEPGAEASGDEATPAAETTVAPATEATAATLPIGATVGPAGLPVMPYDLAFSGGFFEVADFLAGLDELVEARGGNARVQGRLLTVDGFALAPVDDTTGSSGADPKLTVSLTVTTYLTPAEQGLVAGATPGAPAPTTPAPVSGTTTTPTDTTTTAATP